MRLSEITPTRKFFFHLFEQMKRVMRQSPQSKEEAYQNLVGKYVRKIQYNPENNYFPKYLTWLTENETEVTQAFSDMMRTWKDLDIDRLA